MPPFAFRSPKTPMMCALLALLASACGDDSTSGAGGGAAGDGGSAGVNGTAGTAGVGGSGGGATGGDPLKDCGVAANPGVPELALTEVVDGLERAIFLTQAPGDTARLFVVEKAGR